MEEKDALARRLAALTPERQAALQRLLQQKQQKHQQQQTTTKPTIIRRRLPDERVPLSFGQERLWLLDQFIRGNAAYNESNFINLPFALDTEVFRHAVNEIVRRHEALRTSVRVKDGAPIQHVNSHLTLDIPLVDLRQLPPAARRQEALRLAAEQSSIPFDLARTPLLRGSLYRLDAQDYVFALTMHHIICDGWSMGVFAVELTTLYYCFATGKPSPLPELGIQYPDFAIWQREMFDEKSLAPQLAYWRKQLANLGQLEMPNDRTRPAEFTFRGSRREIKITGALFQSLVVMCEREGVTLFMLLLSALYVLIHRYSGQDDIAVGSPVANRSRKGTEPLIGFFINTLVLRANLSGDPRFLDLLSHVREILLAAFTHQDVPLEQIIRELQPPHDKSRNALYQAAFQLFQRPNVPGLRRDAVLPFNPIESGIAKFDFSVELMWAEDEITGYVEYNTDLFDDSRIERMVNHYLRLLESIVADPTRRISELAMLTENEERRLLVEWNATESDYARDANIPDLFDAQARSNPDNVAVKFGDSTLTYRELKRNSDHAAQKLIGLGIKRGELVGLYMERCLELPMALLGILKAGAAFVPLDPGYPPERLSFLLSDSGARAIVTTSRHQHQLPGFGAQLVILDNDDVLASTGETGVNGATSEAVTTIKTAKPDWRISPDDLAYVMYTSGTTGCPKGVAVTHRNILRLVDAVGWINLKPDRNVLQFAPISFDAATFEIWGSLLFGATLVLAPPELLSLDELGGFIKKSKIHTLFITTSLFRQMVESNIADLRATETLIFGGEVMPVAAAKAAWKSLPRTRIVNAYGPTECTTFASFYPITNPDSIGDNLPIGKPIHNTTFFILDKFDNPVPVGVPGELYIGGDGVAQGYWNQPEMTATRFIRDCFSGKADSRLYRTGDIVMYREDGNVLFLGRGDRQIKLSGFRIELSEVEAAIAKHPDVSCAAVMLFEDDESKRLVAFVELSQQRHLTLPDLRKFLSKRIPQYMIPSQLNILEKLFLTPNGKIDYLALRNTIALPVAGQHDYAPPRDETERKLCAIWEELLHAENIAINESFFDLGGHSLIATRLLSRIRETFQVEVTMRDFFDNPTVAGLSEVVGAR